MLSGDNSIRNGEKALDVCRLWSEASERFPIDKN